VAKVRLIGNDAQLVKVTFGTEVTVGNLIPDTWYKITGKAASGSLFGALLLGELFLATTAVKTIVAGDKAMPLTETVWLDCEGIKLTINAEEVKITTLADRATKYRAGKVDVDGSLKAVVTTSETLAAGGILNRFFKLVNFNQASGAATISNIDSSPIFVKAELQKDKGSGETYCFLYAQIELFGMGLGSEGTGAQEFDSKFRLTGIDPIFYTESMT
jgi:hypothetical protein